jgi:hypothetical protein
MVIALHGWSAAELAALLAARLAARLATQHGKLLAGHH